MVRLSSNQGSLIPLAESMPIVQKNIEKVTEEVKKDVTIKVTKSGI
jgi:hypothetical protein